LILVRHSFADVKKEIRELGFSIRRYGIPSQLFTGANYEGEAAA
jgi:hypothetical protein